MVREKSLTIGKRLTKDREEQLLEIARDLFLRQGIQYTTTSQIAEKARVSKTTIYKLFSTKEEMFETIITRATERLIKQIDSLLELDESRPVESIEKAACYIMEAFTAEEHINLLRQLIAEMPRNKKLRSHVQDDIEMLSYIPKRLLTFFENLLDKGLMKHPDTVLAAQTFVMMCTGGMLSLLDAAGGTKPEKQRRLQVDIQLFIDGCHITNPPPTEKRFNK